jgi:hypothetical protein
VIPARVRPNYDQSVSRRSLAVDASIAVLTLGMSLGVLASQGLGVPDASARDLD